MAIAASVVGLLTAASSSFGHCSSWATLMGYSNLHGNMILDEVLDNGGEFIFYVSGSEQVVVFYVDYAGGSVITAWTEDADGKTTVTDGTITSTVSCDGNGGFAIRIEGPGFSPTVYSVSANCQVQIGGHLAFSRVFKDAFGWENPGDDTLTLNHAIDADHMSVTGTNELSQAFSISAQQIWDPIVDGSGTATIWFGTLTATGGATIPCAGASVDDGGESAHAVLLSCFKDNQYGLDVIDRLSTLSAIGWTCNHDDTEAQTERGDLRRNSMSCYTSHATSTDRNIIACAGSGALFCLLSLIPNPLTPELCVLSIGCCVEEIARDISFADQITTEFARVRACICAHADARYSGSPTSSCTFACPNGFP